MPRFNLAEKPTDTVRMDRIQKHFPDLSTGTISDLMVIHGRRILYGLMSEDEMYTTEDVYREIVLSRDTLQDYIFQYVSIMHDKADVIPFDKSPRVYFLCDGGVVMYVGQSCNISSRISSHLKDKTFDSVATFPVPAKELNTIEEMNIHHHNPEYNSAKIDESEHFKMVLRRCVFNAE